MDRLRAARSAIDAREKQDPPTKIKQAKYAAPLATDQPRSAAGDGKTLQ
jgi:hypothetical protein